MAAHGDSGPSAAHPAPAGDPPASAPAGAAPLLAATVTDASTLGPAPPGVTRIDDIIHTDDSAAPDERIGTTFARYRVLARLGAGAMGVVYSAHDPALDRRVALKVLALRQPAGSLYEARLHREAQALARLAHPNVVAIHDVGVTDHSVFLAMQLVDGTTLERTLADTAPAPRRILALFVAAGRGLAAAHDAGIVHRDFKPANVLVARGGEVCVGDFGLARSALDAEVAAATDAPALLDARLTRAGAMVGTPLYMAPEQLRGEPATARSDQFSFCVALWQALHGAHPFVVGDAPPERAAMLAAMARDTPVPPVRGAASRRVRRALRRGLRHDPAARWPTMTALVGQLEPPARPRGLLAGLALAGLGAGLALAFALGIDRDADPCARAADRLAAVWTPATRGALATAFTATGLPYAAATAATTGDAVDRYATGWREMRLDACRATRVRGEQGDDVLDRRMRCLDGRLAELDALLHVLAAPGPDLLADAARAVGKLSPLAACADAPTLLAAPLPALAVRPRIDAIDAVRLHAHAAYTAGRYVAVDAQLPQLIADARATSWSPVVARVLYLAGQIDDRLARYPAAAARFREASIEAARGGDATLAATALGDAAMAMIELDRPADALLVSDDAAILAAPLAAATPRVLLHRVRALALARQSRFPDSDAEYARAAALLQPQGDELELAILHSAWSAMLMEMGELARAETMQRATHATLERRLGVDHPTTLSVLGNLGNTLINADRGREAIPLLERVLASRRRTLPAGNVRISNTLQMLGGARATIGDLVGAEAALREALAIRTAGLGPDASPTLSSAYQLAATFRRAGRLAEALALHRDVLARKIAVLGPDHIQVANSLDAIGRAYADRHEPRLALDHLDRARALREKLLGTDNLDVAASRAAVASLAADTGDCARAIREAEIAVALYRRHTETELGDRADAQITLASCHHRLGHHAAARTALDELARQPMPDGVDPARFAAGLQLLAELRWTAGEHAAAIDAATRALAAVRQSNDVTRGTAIERWLAGHRG